MCESGTLPKCLSLTHREDLSYPEPFDSAQGDNFNEEIVFKLSATFAPTACWINAFAAAFGIDQRAAAVRAAGELGFEHFGFVLD